MCVTRKAWRFFSFCFLHLIRKTGWPVHHPKMKEKQEATPPSGLHWHKAQTTTFSCLMPEPETTTSPSQFSKHLHFCFSSVCSSSINDIPSIPPPPYTPPIPAVDRSTKPTDHFMSTGLFGGSGGIRDVVVPADLMKKFIVAAHSNTLRKTETMGILCGKVVSFCFL